MTDFTGPAVHVMRHCRTELCLVDGIDRLRTKDLQPTFDYLAEAHAARFGDSCR